MTSGRRGKRQSTSRIHRAAFMAMCLAAEARARARGCTCTNPAPTFRHVERGGGVIVVYVDHIDPACELMIRKRADEAGAA